MIVWMWALVLPMAASAKPGFGEQVDAYCSALGRGTPYADLAGQGFLSECSLCHQFTYPPELPNKSNQYDPPASEYLAARSSGDFSWFCPGATNQPPLVTPIADRTLNVGEMLVIDVVASDPDGDPLVLTVANAPFAPWSVLLKHVGWMTCSAHLKSTVDVAFGFWPSDGSKSHLTSPTEMNWTRR